MNWNWKELQFHSAPSKRGFVLVVGQEGVGSRGQKKREPLSIGFSIFR